MLLCGSADLHNCVTATVELLPFTVLVVTLTNSPLYEYLQDLGHTDFEVCSSVSQKAKQCAVEEGQRERTVHTAQKDVGFRFDTLRTILQQEVLLQEDVELIEFLDPSILSAGQSNASPKPLISPERLPHHILSDVTQGLPHTHAACLEELKRSYEFYRYFETQHQSGFERPTRTKQKSRELNSLQTAVRSLQLHLKALLNEVIILEDELEKLVSTKETPELTTEAHQVLEQKLKFIQPHMQASNSCWEEAISQVEKMGGRNPNKKGKLEASCDNLQRTSVPLIQPTVYIEDRDPIPEEQELEAYVDYSDMDNEYNREAFDCFSQEERERQKREREESKRVLQELKSVLGFKASEAERQKWKQLLFSDHAAVKPLSPVESLKLLNNLESHMNSNTEKQDCSQSCDKSEESDYNSEVNTAGKSRTEYLYEDPEMERNKDSPPEEGISTEAEEIMCYRYEGEVEDLKPSDMDRVEVSQPPSVDALHSKIKHRLAQLHISTDFNFTSGLAAQAAARSFSFTTMQEQTFGDDDEDEEEEKEEGKGQEHEDLIEDFENEGSGSESEGRVQA
ncbi:hypothetical protein CIB84_001206 [Bambusicola thoracicus]|uniref:Vezatin n=1 Tax=Bambusicola thoracicus TaxID=9083 RepID=A0A2P4TF92_BAMTH|nr:hypothetical protein CIB84_001206 [Bambusicola thoracicus]